MPTLLQITCTAAPGHGGLDQSLAGSGQRDVSLVEGDGAGQRMGGTLDLLAGLGVDVGAQYMGSGAGECERDATADAFGAAGDNDYFSAEVRHECGVHIGPGQGTK